LLLRPFSSFAHSDIIFPHSDLCVGYLSVSKKSDGQMIESLIDR